jgi:16S rRNA (adenine1518-N6/adenine1519-N6)-dimethyltransferase
MKIPETENTLQAYTSQMLKKLGIRPKKSLGQNFLISNRIRDRIIDMILPVGGMTLIEIGGGLGALSVPLSELASGFAVYEIDNVLREYLDSTLKAFNPTVIVNGDFLKEYPPYQLPDKGFKVVGNIPYQITAPILETIYDAESLPKETVLMVQHEVAERITANPGTKLRGRLTIWVEFHADITDSFNVRRTMFYPSPEVDSQVIKLITRDKLPLSKNEKDSFFDMVKTSFAMKRKTIVNNLERWKDGFKKSAIEKVLQDLKISTSARAEELSLDELIGIFHRLTG